MDSIKFGTGGFRGIIAKDFTFANISLITHALSNIIIKQDKHHKEVVIGYDHRFMSEEFALHTARVLASFAIKTFLFKTPTPTPVVMSMIKNEGLFFGIMITASHNPYQYNGFKLFLEKGIDADVAFTSLLENEIKNVELDSIKTNIVNEKKFIKKINYLPKYLNQLTQIVSPIITGTTKKIIFNNLFGVGIVAFNQLVKHYKLEGIRKINVKRDPFFNFSYPNPTKDTLSTTATFLLNNKYDFALGTDSDADRLGVIDNNGQYVDNNEILASIYYYLVKYRNFKGDIVKNIATSTLIDKLASKLGFNCHTVDVGFKNISSKLIETDALIGGESSGGLTIRNYLFGKDAILTSMLFIEMQTVMNMSVSKIITLVKEFAEYNLVWSETNISIDKNADLSHLFNGEINIFNAKNFHILNNNIKYNLHDSSWILFRKSGTEPILRIVIEASSDKLSSEYITKISNYLKELK